MPEKAPGMLCDNHGDSIPELAGSVRKSQSQAVQGKCIHQEHGDS